MGQCHIIKLLVVLFFRFSSKRLTITYVHMYHFLFISVLDDVGYTCDYELNLINYLIFCNRQLRQLGIQYVRRE